jgi:hypothetical protein
MVRVRPRSLVRDARRGGVEVAIALSRVNVGVSELRDGRGYAPTVIPWWSHSVEQVAKWPGGLRSTTPLPPWGT